MNRLAYVSEIVIHNLPAKNVDRRGPIATLLMLEPSDEETYEVAQTIRAVQMLTALLDDSYSLKCDGVAEEHNSCWISFYGERPEKGSNIVVRHKYWSDNQVQMFVRLLETLAHPEVKVTRE